MAAVVSGASRYGRKQRIAVWFLRGMLAVVFAAAGAAKIAGVPTLVAEFGQIGLGQWFRYVTGLTEIVAAVLLLIPATGFVGAIGVLFVCLGALVAQIGPLHGDVIHVIVLGAASAYTAWLLRPV